MTYSAIIVLGNLMNSRGELNDESTARMDCAIEAFHHQQAPCMITCGWAYREDSDIMIADAMKSYAIGYGAVPNEAIISEIHSRDTVGDAIFSKRNRVNLKDWDSLLVVTSDYHCERTREIFTFVYGDQYEIQVEGAETPDPERISEKESIAAFRNTFRGIMAGDDVAIYTRLCERHPFYNGDIHAAIEDVML